MMKRRQFLKTGGTVISLPLLLNGMPLSALARSPFSGGGFSSRNDKVLVLIQLNGGNDGLNTLIPLDQYDRLANARANLIIPENQLLALNDTLALHPAMSGLRDLYDDGRLGIVHSVGYPNQNRSHFRSMDIWQSGSPATEQWDTGWLGRYFQTDHGDFPDNYPNEEFPHPFAIAMGSAVSETCQGTTANFSLTLDDPFALSPLSESQGGATPDTPYGRELDFLRTTIAQANAYAAEITEVVQKGSSLVEYPDTGLARQLRNIALLVSGGLQTKVYVARIGGFDTHANQIEEGAPATGAHAELLAEISDAVAAFQADLKQLGLEERVIGMTFSEFGRQIRSNSSFGTDHGTAAPLLVFGSCINNHLLGENPEIPATVDVQEGVPMQHDFRDVYGSVLTDWFELEEEEVRSLLYPDFRYLPILKNCNLATSSDTLVPEAPFLENFPNPFRTSTTIRFQSSGKRLRLSIFDAKGSEIAVLIDKTLPAGEHQVQFDGHRLPPGNYYYRLHNGFTAVTRPMIKL